MYLSKSDFILGSDCQKAFGLKNIMLAVLP